MIAIREFVQVKNHQLNIQLPVGFDFDEVEVVIMPAKTEATGLTKDESTIGKIGFVSQSFTEDDEDYSAW